MDSRTVQSTPESGARAGYDAAKRRKGSKVRVAVDTLGQLLAVVVTPAAVHEMNLQVIAKPEGQPVWCCCLAAGLSNAASAGPLGSAAWPAILDASL
jgi:hypothetical protein